MQTGTIHQDTICAIATAQGGAIGTIRISGPDAIGITSQVFAPAQGKPLTARKPYTLTFGYIKEEEEVIDEVLVALFRAPHSYTGEDSTEITCHGSPYILQKVLQLLLSKGCRIASPGEYTQRAFLNGKMDLSQAEAVADLIASASASAHRLAMNQMRGGFSRELSTLREKLLHFTSLIELELDFSDHEELEFADRTELQHLASEIEQKITRLTHTFRVGNALKNGIPVAIIGETNAGKSTLLNALLNEERAIVSDIHGTTRDVIEDTTILGGITFRFIDTAGIRETNDTIETLGIERTFQKLEQAEIVLWMIDATDLHAQITQLAPQLLPRCNGKQVILVLNKADLVQAGKDLLKESQALIEECLALQQRKGILSQEGTLLQEEPTLLQEEQTLPQEEQTLQQEGQTLQQEKRTLQQEERTLPTESQVLSFKQALSKENLATSFPQLSASLTPILLSAKNRTHLNELQQLLITAAHLPHITQEDVIVTNARHYEALIQALESIHRVCQGLQDNLSGDFISQDIRECIFHLSDIAGEVTNDEVLQNIFEHFCIGK